MTGSLFARCITTEPNWRAARAKAKKRPKGKRRSLPGVNCAKAARPARSSRRRASGPARPEDLAVMEPAPFGPSSPLLRATHISKRYEPPDGAPPIIVLNDVSLELGNSETLSIVGPSGSGKSTLLHIIGTLDQPSSGQ